MPALDTESVLPVAPVFHVIVPEHPAAVNIAVSVPQRLVLSAVNLGAVGVPPFEIFTMLETPLVPQPFTQVAEYVLELTETLVPVAPVLQVTVPEHPIAINVAFSVPQTLILSDEMIGAAGELP